MANDHGLRTLWRILTSRAWETLTRSIWRAACWRHGRTEAHI